MPSRVRLDTPPENPWERARWLDARLPRFLAQIPLDSARSGWGALLALEAELFGAAEAPVLDLDPACPRCGVETDEGTVERLPDGDFLVRYQSCGHTFQASAR